MPRRSPTQLTNASRVLATPSAMRARNRRNETSTRGDGQQRDDDEMSGYHARSVAPSSGAPVGLF